MIVDSSAIVGILTSEPDSSVYAEALERSRDSKLSAANMLETSIVIDRERDPVLSRRLDTLIQEASITIESFTEEQAKIARQAYRDFGKGSGHPAQLNFGDCFTYALAKVTGEPLLFKGNDFCRTDLKSAV